MIQVFRTALRLEFLALLRMRETYTFGLLPAVLSVPVLLGGVLVFISFQPDPVLAVPLEDPPGMHFDKALSGHFDVLRTDEPERAVTEGRADMGVIRWSLRDPPDGALLDMTVITSVDQRVDQVGEVLTKSLRKDLDRQIEAAGGAAMVDRRIAKIVTEAPPSVPDGTARQAAWGVFTSLVAYLGCFLIPVRTTAERLSGALEALAVTATPVIVVYVARLLVCTTFFFALAATPGAMIWLILGAEFEMDIRPLDVIEVGTLIAAFNTGFLVCGLLASSVRMSLYYGSYLILLALPAFGAAAFSELSWVPVASLASNTTPYAQPLRIALTGLVVLSLLGLLHRLARNERVLPPGEGDE